MTAGQEWPEEDLVSITHTTSSDVFPIARLDLEEEVRRMRACPMPGGTSGRTLFRTANLRIVLMIVNRGTQLPDHHVDGALTIQTLDGRVTVSLLGSSLELSSGCVLAIERGLRHALVAIEESAILLTIAWDGKPRLASPGEVSR